MKILILSPYTNAELRSHLQMRGYNALERLLIERCGLSKKVILKDTAPWVGDMISELEKLDGIEIFSVSPQIKMAKKVQHFTLNKTHYYFYSSDFSQAARLVKNYKWWKRIETCSSRVKKIADEINPDIIILFGTENLTISYPILKLTNYPVFCILQTVYHKPDRAKYGIPNEMIMQLETEIAEKVKFFGSGKYLGGLLKQVNPNIVVLAYKWISGRLPKLEIPPKKYDFVNFAFTMDTRKGDEDAVRALAIVKRKYPNVTLNLSGGMASARKAYIERLVLELGLIDNVSFTPMFEKKEDMYRHILQARFAVLPVKLDLVSTTTREAMYYKLPVVTNITPGTPLLNKEKECVLLTEKMDIEGLADNMLKLMEDENLAKTLAENGYDYMLKQMDNTSKVVLLMSSLQAIINNHVKGTSIPEELLLGI